MTLERTVWYGRFDKVFGTAAELEAAGLIRLDELPGQPGRNKTMCTYNGPVQLPKGSQVARGNKSRPGYRQISRMAKDRYCVVVDVGDAEALRREVDRSTKASSNAVVAAAVLAAGAPEQWAARVGLDFAARVLQRRHLQVV